MFNSTRTVQMKAITEMATKLESIDSVLKTRTKEFDNNMVIDVVAIHALGTNTVDIKSMHRISQDSRIRLVMSSTEEREEFLIVRFRLSMQLKDYSPTELERIEERNQWYKDMESDVADNVREEQRIEEAEKQLHESIVQMMNDDINQDIHDYDFNQDPELTDAQKDEINSIAEMIRIEETMEKRERIDILKQNINIIENNNKALTNEYR